MQFSIRKAITTARWLGIRLRHGVQFGRPGYIGRGFSLQMEPDGYALGGRFDCGPGARFSEGVIVAPYGGSIQIGRDFYCGPYTVLYGHGGLRIGNQVMIASHCVIIPANHNVDDPLKPISAQGEARRGVSIEDDVWIGCGVRVLDGVKIESGAVIGAGAVVLRDVPGRAVMAGVPARVIRRRELGAKS